MLERINPMYTEFLIINFDNKTPNFYTLYHIQRNIPTGIGNDEIVPEDNCLIAYSDKEKEVISYRNELIKDGYYKPTELYTKTIPNLKCYRKNI